MAGIFRLKNIYPGNLIIIPKDNIFDVNIICAKFFNRYPFSFASHRINCRKVPHHRISELSN